MVTGDPGAHGVHVIQKQVPREGQGPAITQQQKMEVLSVLGLHQSMKIVS